MFTGTYSEIDKISWRRLSSSLERTSLALGRVDERFRTSPVADGVRNRLNFHEACATLYLAGELVQLEDLVLSEDNLLPRASTHALLRAKSVLENRRRSAKEGPIWVLSDANIFDNRRIASDPDTGGRRSQLVYDPLWDEDERLDAWRAALKKAHPLPALVAAAIAWDSWLLFEPVQHAGWKAGILAAAVLRQRQVTKHHWIALHAGGRVSDFRRGHHHDITDRIIGFLEWVETGCSLANKDFDRLTLAREVMSLKLKGKTAKSRLPDLVDLVLEMPFVTVSLAAKKLKVSPQAVERMLGEVGSTLREITGRQRYRAWGIL